MTSGRIALASLVVGLSLAGAAWLHGSKLTHVPRHCQTGPVGGPLVSCDSGNRFGGGWVWDKPAHNKQAPWQDPLAIFLAIAGLGAGVAILTSTSVKRRNETSTEEHKQAIGSASDNPETFAVEHVASGVSSVTPRITVAATSISTQRTRARKPLQILGYLAFVIAGAPLAATASNDSAIMGLPLLVVFLVVIGSTGYGVSRLRGGTRSWQTVAFGRTAVLVTLLVLSLAAIGQTGSA